LGVWGGPAAIFWPQSETIAAPQSASAPTPPKPVAATPVTPAPTTKPGPAKPAAPATAAAAPTAPKSAAREPVRTEVPAGGLTLGLDKTIPHAKVTPGSILKQSDGSILADGKYRIEGEGTRENPFRVSWDCLASANKTYIPRLKEDLMPQRVAMLDGAWVRIDGYFALPLMLQESSEILVMLNQWDGCCIGVPPTPYDAMEVKLLEPVKPDRRHAFNFGTVTGRLRVDPMLVENWLVGLYRLEEASLSQSGL